MSKKFTFGATFTKSVSEDGDESIIIEGKASTNATDRVGDVIISNAWDNDGLTNFKKNPIILFNHNYDEPIGRAVEITSEEDGLNLKAEITDPKIVKLISKGVLNAFSVGFIPKDLDYDRVNGGFVIKSAELLEVSVVSVPANQEAIFSQVKSWNDDDFTIFKSLLKGAADLMQSSANVVPQGTKHKENEMDPKELQKLLDQAAEKAAAKVRMENAERVAAEKAAAEKLVKEKEATEAAHKAAVEAGKTGAERLLEEMSKKLEGFDTTIGEIEELKKGLKDRGAEIEALRTSKRVFGVSTESKTFEQANADEILDLHILGIATKKGWTTKAGKEFLEKASANADSGVQVPVPDVNPFENITTTTIERDIQNELVLFPMFRNIQMNSNTMTLPILPDAGFAEFSKTASGSNPHGNLASRGDTVGSPYAGNDLEAKILRVKTMISQSYLGDETEEDAILPILPLIRESIVRSHARTIEHSILLGGHTTALISNAFDGLLEMAKDASAITQGVIPAAGDTLTAARLLQLRINMGKYGVRPNDVVYLVSQQGYFDLLQDGEFQDANLVGAAATKMTGAIGQVYGSNVVLCDEFNSRATGEAFAMAVNTRNFVTTRLRGIRLERDRDVANQRDLIVASQRLGFEDIFEGTKAVTAEIYAGS